MRLSANELNTLLNARCAHPHALLGMHPVKRKGRPAVVVRAFLQDAETCEVVQLTEGNGTRFPMTRVHEKGIFEVEIPDVRHTFPYRLRTRTRNLEIRQFFDPYAFLPSLGEQDVYLFNEGNEHRAYTKLGAHLKVLNAVPGVSFAVWAPGALSVSVVGNFNAWDGRYHPMRPLGSSGIWELFIPGLEEGELYKFHIRGQDDHVRLKSDPYGTYFEAPPNNASIVCAADSYEWNDREWVERRAREAGQRKPVSVYEVHLGSWKRLMEDGGRPLGYRELAPMLADYVVEMGFTHIEIMPVAEHPFTGSWGYQVTGYFAPTHRYGRPEDFMFFVDHMHQRGIGVILDWVPGHFPRDAFALAEFDGTHLYEHQDPRQGYHKEWGTLIFNYGRNEVRCFLTANALSWMDRYHIDGLRVDAVASMLYLDYSREHGEWIPNRYGGRENIEAIRFLRETNELVHRYYPGVLMIAEESTAWPGVTKPVPEAGLGFDFKWNMGWMNDILRYFSREPLFRKYHQNDLTFGMIYQYSERFMLALSHDEVVHGKGSLLMKMGAPSITEKAHNLRALYGFMWTYPGKKLLFMGSEFGQSSEWRYDQSLDWHLCQYMDHEGIRRLVGDLNRLYRDEPALWETDYDPSGFRWINCNDADSSVASFLRTSASNETVFAVVCHNTPVVRAGYRVGVPFGGYWQECINTDSDYYGGTGIGNLGGVRADKQACDGYEYSLKLTLPPCSTSIFRWEG